MPATAGTPIALAPRKDGDNEVLQWLVVLSEPDAANGARIASAALGIPVKGSALAGTSLVALTAPSAEPIDDNGINYKVEVEYGYATDGSGEPWSRKDKIRRATKHYHEFAGVDVLGVPIANAVGDPIEGGLAFDKFNPVRIVRRMRKFTQFNPEAAEACIGTLNQASFSLNPPTGVTNTPIAAKKALLLLFTCDDAVWSDGTYYFDIQFEIEIEKQVPIEKVYIANKGWNYIVTPSNPVKEPAFTPPDANGKRARREVYMNDGGNELLPAAYTGATLTNGVWARNNDLEFTGRRTADWSTWISS